jgi:hypothetical protein
VCVYKSSKCFEVHRCRLGRTGGSVEIHNDASMVFEEFSILYKMKSKLRVASRRSWPEEGASEAGRCDVEVPMPASPRSTHVVPTCQGSIKDRQGFTLTLAARSVQHVFGGASSETRDLTGFSVLDLQITCAYLIANKRRDSCEACQDPSFPYTLIVLYGVYGAGRGLSGPVASNLVAVRHSARRSQRHSRGSFSTGHHYDSD